MSEETPITGPMNNQPAVGAGQQMHVQIREDKMKVIYSNVSRIGGTLEELFVDFAINTQHPDQPNTAVMDVSTRVMMNFYSAKRLALALSQAVQRYEQVCGPIEIDPRRRNQR